MQSLLESLAADPSDWHVRLAYSDWLEEHDRLAESYRERSRAWLWAWAHSLRHVALCFVQGRGVEVPLVAYFAAGDPREHVGVGWREPGYFVNAEPPTWPCVRVRFESRAHDVPADIGRQRRRRPLSAARINAGACGWLLPSRYEDGTLPPGEEVPAGASVLQFCLAVTKAGGWWAPVDEVGEMATATAPAGGLEP